METGRSCRARWRIVATAHNICVLIGQITSIKLLANGQLSFQNESFSKLGILVYMGRHLPEYNILIIFFSPVKQIVKKKVYLFFSLILNIWSKSTLNVSLCAWVNLKKWNKTKILHYSKELQILISIIWLFKKPFSNGCGTFLHLKFRNQFYTWIFKLYF